MRQRFLTLVISWTVLVPVALAASDFAAWQASARAHACCAKTRFACAGVKSPDDCCQTMGHGAGRAVPATVASVQPLDANQTVAVMPALPFPVEPRFVERAPVDAFKRPHDPPHLHTFILLI